MKAFNEGKWIWRNKEAQFDEYVDFLDRFKGDGEGEYILKIAADSNYTVYINGELSAFGQYADYPKYKVYDSIDISKFIRKDSENRMVIIVWYYGEDTQTYIHGKAGLIYEIEKDGKVLTCSSEETLSRLSLDYVSYRKEFISGQLGFTYHYNAEGYDGFIQSGENGFEKSRLVENISTDFNIRPIERLNLLDRIKSRVCTQGTFEYTTNHDSPTHNMQYAALSFRFPSQIAGYREDFSSPIKYVSDSDKNIYFIVDLGNESVGFLDLEFTVPQACRIDVGYGEHLVDGRCRTAIRGFSCTYYAKKGKNSFLNTFRRFGCRYIQVFAHTKEIEVNYVGLRPTVYPVQSKGFCSDNLLRNTIYDVCVNTLISCMHEHYEDCPWREQALYTMDSRNQMLCGYYALNEYRFPRASLKLISLGQRKDGLLTLCYPAGRDYPIPFFSAVYFMQMNEYIKYSKDTTLAKECFGVLEKLCEAFQSRMCNEGYLRNFYGVDDNGVRYWNFYEWSETMDGGEQNWVEAIESPFNAIVSIAFQNMSKICESLGETEKSAMYMSLSEKLNVAIEKYFHDEKTGLFRSFIGRHEEKYSVLTNALAMLCGAADNVDKTNILKILTVNGSADTGLYVIPNTLSMNCFRFDALLHEDFDKYKSIILDEIDRDYLFMLREGATTFWETIKGAADFGGAGSLCHGWSALPIYYYEILGK